MGRIVVSFSLVLAAAALAACDVGALPGFAPDAGGGGGSGSGSAGVCEEINAAAAGDGNHNPGQSCQVAGCHLIGNTGLNAPAYSYSGTLYKDTAGTQPYAGATIFVSFNGVEKKVLTGTNGNFYFVPGAGGIEPPTNAMTATTRASGCPTVSVPMVGALVQGGGNCNNCHRNGGTTLPVYLQ